VKILTKKEEMFQMLISFIKPTAGKKIFLIILQKKFTAKIVKVKFDA
jgi:hypothetical protein